MKYKSLLFVFILSYFPLAAQLQFFSPEAMNGYTLFLGEKLFLVNNCGEVVNDWQPVVPKYHVKLLPTGNIVFIDWTKNAIVERDWEDNFVSEIHPADPTIKLEYEVIVLENGNYLCVGRKDFSTAEFEGIGYNLDSKGSPHHVDVVVELASNTGETIWQWNIADHVIQERSDTIPNYGSVIEHPELLNMDAISTLDWKDEESWMINGMDYHPDLDQIVLSVRKMGEVIIIDHSTTAAEAAGHTGGQSGKGGDILYRWGNPQNYNRGIASDQKLFYQHNPNWIHYGEHIGKIAIYNNGLYRTGVPFEDWYSNAPVIETPILSDGSYTIDPNLAFEPALPAIDYGLPGSDNFFYSNYTSAHKVLQNGNVLITVGDDHRMIELKPDGTLVWEYKLITAHFTFRAEKYPPNYPAFEGRDLTPGGVIEDIPSPVPCELVSTGSTDISENLFKAWVDPESRQLYVRSSIGTDYQMVLFDLLGRKMQSLDTGNGLSIDGDGIDQFQVASPIKGIVILSIMNKETGIQRSTKLFVP